jgi:hypothetical protein
MQAPPLSEFLVIRDDGRLYTSKWHKLFHPVRALKLPRGLPARHEWVEFTIW